MKPHLQHVTQIHSLSGPTVYTVCIIPSPHSFCQFQINQWTLLCLHVFVDPQPPYRSVQGFIIKQICSRKRLVLLFPFHSLLVFLVRKVCDRSDKLKDGEKKNIIFT